MKKILCIALMLCLVSRVVLADTSAEIVKVDKDDNGSIRVWTQYKIDGVEVESRYPKIDSKYVYCTQYSVKNFYGMTDQEIEDRVDKDLNAHCETLIITSFRAEVKQMVVDANEDLLNTTVFKGLPGHKVTKTEAIVEVDTDFNGLVDTEWTVKTDLTKTEKSIEEVTTDIIAH